MAKCAPPDADSVLRCRDRTLRIWDPNTGTMLRVLEGHMAEVVCVTVLSVNLFCMSSQSRGGALTS